MFMEGGNNHLMGFVGLSRDSYTVCWRRSSRPGPPPSTSPTPQVCFLPRCHTAVSVSCSGPYQYARSFHDHSKLAQV